eukprot:EG_transcript_3318
MTADVGFPGWAPGEPLPAFVDRCRAAAAAADPSLALGHSKQLLEAFVCENFLGPPTPADQPVNGTRPVGDPLPEEAHKVVVEALYIDGEVMPISIRRPLLLLVPLRVLDTLEPTTLVTLWRLRANFIYQRVLSRLAHSVRKVLDACMMALLEKEEELSGLGVPPAQVYLEMGHVHSTYREADRAQRMFYKARDLTGIRTELIGALGVRTEHQSFKTAQLFLKTTTRLPPEPFQPPPPGARVRTIQSEDCNVLQRPSQRNLVFKEVDPSAEAAMDNIAHLDQAVLLSLCLDVRNNNPHHGLTGHEMLAYVERVMSCTNLPYSVECMCLSLKAKLEWERNRVQERALLQLQEMVDAFMAEDGDSAARFPWFWIVPLPSYVGMLKDLGRRYLKLGMNKTAESVGELLQDWSFVVTCCLRQGNAKRAEKVARDLLEKEPDNPLHWCALAEATSSKEHYLTAWEKSNHKLAAPMRGLAQLCVEKEDWEEAVGYFDQALSLNPLYGGNWFTLGVACQRTERYQRALYAFTRVVMLDPEEGQAWNNLGTVYLKLKQKKQALTAMTMACKLMEFSWRVRENHFRIATDLGEWQTAMNDLILLLDSKGHRYKMDLGDLKLVVDGLAQLLLDDGYVPGPEEDAIHTVVEESEDGIPKLVVTPEPGHVPLTKGSLRQRVETFLNKLNGTYTDNEGIYGVLGDFYRTVKEGRRAYEYYIKQDRAAKLSDWKNDPQHLQHVVEVTERHCDLAVQLGDLQLTMQSQRLVTNTLKGAAENFAEHALVARLRAVQGSLSQTACGGAAAGS